MIYLTRNVKNFTIMLKNVCCKLEMHKRKQFKIFRLKSKYSCWWTNKNKKTTLICFRSSLDISNNFNSKSMDKTHLILMQLQMNRLLSKHNFNKLNWCNNNRLLKLKTNINSKQTSSSKIYLKFRNNFSSTMPMMLVKDKC